MRNKTIDDKELIRILKENIHYLQLELRDARIALATSKQSNLSNINNRSFLKKWHQQWTPMDGSCVKTIALQKYQCQRPKKSGGW